MPTETYPPLTDIVPLHVDYRLPSANIEDSFDWDHILRTRCTNRGLPTRGLHLVVFGSLRHPDADGDLIHKLDNDSFVEAHELEPDALLHYHPGEVAPDGYAQSWCLWTDREAAKRATHGPLHAKAAKLAMRGAILPGEPPRFYRELCIRLFTVSQDKTGIENGIRFETLDEYKISFV